MARMCISISVMIAARGRQPESAPISKSPVNCPNSQGGSMSSKRKPAHTRSQPTRHGAGQRSALRKPGPDTAKPWYKRASLWLVLTIATGVIGGAAGVIGSKLGDAVTAPKQPSGPSVLVSQVSIGSSDSSLSYALPGVHHRTHEQLTGLAASGYTTHTAAFNRFVEANHGGPADGKGAAVVELTLRGNRPYPVLVTGMKIIKQCGPPMRGTLFYSPSAAQPSNAMIGFDLDEAIPQADIIRSDGNLGPNYFLRRHIRLDSTQDTQGISVEAITTGSCTFRLVLQVLDESSTTYETVDDSTTIGAGPAFRFTRMVNVSNEPVIAAYGLAYIGGVMDTQCHDTWTRVSSTFSFAESPQSIACNRT